MSRRVAIASDHAGVELKAALVALLNESGHSVLDLGTHDTQPVDYPDFAQTIGRTLLDGKADRGILLCGSGVGASVAANKLPGIRADLCHDTYSAHQGVEHDDMNVLVLGARVIGPVLAEETTIHERINNMKATQKLHNLGQSLWLDNITRDLLNQGTLKSYIDELSVTGLTSNPSIFDGAIKGSAAYDDAIAEGLATGRAGEELFFDLAIADLIRAADLFRPNFDRTNGVDGWVSLEVSPLLAYDTASTIAAAKELFARAERPNLFIKIPGTREGLPAIEEAIFAGVPVNVTLLFSREQYLAAAEAFLRGIERRIAAGLNPRVGSVASVFISRWDVAVADEVAPALNNRLGIAVANRIYQAYREVLASPRWQRASNHGFQPQRLLWASTGTKDPEASDTLYVEELAAPFTVNTIPEATLNAFAEHGKVGAPMPADGEKAIVDFQKAGIDMDALAARLQEEGAAAFVKSWNHLLSVIEAKSGTLAQSQTDGSAS